MKVTHNLAEVLRQSAQAKSALIKAGARALNTVAFDGRADLQTEMRKVFDRPTPFALNAVSVDRASPYRLRADVYLRYPGGKAVDPNNVLKAQIDGGRRGDKGIERSLQRLGVLTRSWQVVPGTGIPSDKIDRFGNVKGSFVIQILSYFQGFSEQGYRSNMKAARYKSLAKRKRTASGYMEIRGVEYFISRGRGTWAGRSVQRANEQASDRSRQEQHLPPGIWSRSGIHGSIVKPIFMFVRRPMYSKRLRFDEVIQAVADNEMQAIYEWNVQDALQALK